MSGRIKPLKAKEAVKILEKFGFEKRRQTGSHLILKNPKTKRIITVPIHNKELKKGTVRGIIRQSGVKAEEFLKKK